MALLEVDDEVEAGELLASQVLHAVQHRDHGEDGEDGEDVKNVSKRICENRTTVARSCGT